MRQACSASRPSEQRTNFALACLGAAGVVMFLSVTNIITYEVAPVPLLWVIPLGIYLMAFVLNFKKNPWCPSWIIRYIGPIIGLAGHDVFFVAKTFFAGASCDCLALWIFIFYLHVHPASVDPLQAFFKCADDIILCDDLSGGIFRRYIDQLDHSFDIQYPDRIFSGVIVGGFNDAASILKSLLFGRSCLCVFLAVSAFFVWPYFVKEYHLWSFVLLWAAVWFSFLGLASDKKFLQLF